MCSSIHVSYASEDVRAAGCGGDHAALAHVTVCVCACACACARVAVPVCLSVPVRLGWDGVCEVHQVVETLSVKLNDALEEYIRPRVVSRNFIMQHADYASALNDVILCAWAGWRLACLAFDIVLCRDAGVCVCVCVCVCVVRATANLHRYGC